MRLIGFETTQPSLLLRLRDPADKKAWWEFGAKYQELILRYCRSRGLQQSDAEDVCQVVMLGLSKALPNFDYSPTRGRFRNYLGRAVRNAILYCRNRPKDLDQALDSIVLASTPAPDLPPEADEVWEREWVDHHCRLAMTTIRRTFEPRSVEVFDRLLAGDTVKAVAESLGTTPHAVYKIKHRVRDKMKELITVQIRQEDEPQQDK